MDAMTFSAICDRLEEITASGTPLCVMDAVCETGAAPKVVRSAFAHLSESGRATLVGGHNRGWLLTQKPRR